MINSICIKRIVFVEELGRQQEYISYITPVCFFAIPEKKFFVFFKYFVFY